MQVRNGMIPMVVEQGAMGERAYDIYSRLLKDRIVFIGEEITEPLANLVVAEMLFLEKQDPGKDIDIYINSPGGSVYAGFAIYDVMTHVSCDVATTCVGMAASMGSLLLAGGTPGKRFAMPNSRVMIHQTSGGYRGTMADASIYLKEMGTLYDKYVSILSERTGKTQEAVRADCDRDFWMSAEEAREYGLIDSVIDRKRQT